VRRILLIAAALIAAGMLAATPAIAGLAGNPSFSHDLPVDVPSQAKSPQLADDDHHGSPTATVTPAPSSARHLEPGDEHGSATESAEPGDEHGSATTHVEPGDDHGSATENAESSGSHGDGGHSSAATSTGHDG
jgi:hypothetical protein